MPVADLVRFGRRRAAGRPLASVLLALLIFAWPPVIAFAQAPTGGLVPGARVVVVTSLADDGPGSLRRALASPGPAVILFSVGGYISLKTELPINHGRLTVAGETAPGSGIVLRGGGLRIRASDVLVSHIAVYAGSTTDKKRADSLDAIGVYGSISRKDWVRNVALLNVSAGWGVDENIGVQGMVDGVRIERSLIAEGLRHGGHPKGYHSMNLLLGGTVRGAEILGNVFAASNQRSARMTQGNVVAMVNNLVVAFGAASTQLDPTTLPPNAGAIDVIGNAYIPGPDARCKMSIVQIHPRFFDATPPTPVHLADNVAAGGRANCASAPPAPEIMARLSPAPLVPATRWKTMPASSLFPRILDQAGARPSKRNPIDARIVETIRDGRSRLIDSEADVGGWPDIAETRHELAPPVKDGAVLRTERDIAAMREWLCRARLSVGDSLSCR